MSDLRFLREIKILFSLISYRIHSLLGSFRFSSYSPFQSEDILVPIEMKRDDLRGYAIGIISREKLNCYKLYHFCKILNWLSLNVCCSRIIFFQLEEIYIHIDSSGNEGGKATLLFICTNDVKY